MRKGTWSALPHHTEVDMSDENFVRPVQIYGDRKRGITPILPISRSHFWQLVKRGVIPQPFRLGSRVTLWRRSDIAQVLERLTQQA
ncbi:MAG: helix-turn-helix transcriptional regulator [Methylococcaceae bacterium]